jgi:hypothetical protein
MMVKGFETHYSYFTKSLRVEETYSILAMVKAILFLRLSKIVVYGNNASLIRYIDQPKTSL